MVSAILILSLNYAPEPTGFAPHSAALAEYLAARGHHVTVVTGFPFAPRWRRWPAYRGRLSSIESLHGVTVARVSHFIPRTPRSPLQRLLMEASFCLSVAWMLLWLAVRGQLKPAVVLYVGAQPAIAMLARITAAIARARYFVNINDLAASAAADVGIVRTRWIHRALERFEYAAYLPATGASVLCGSFVTALAERGYSRERIRLIRSPVDLDLVRPLTRRPEQRQSLNLPPDAFVVMFAGSMGLKQGLQNLVDAAIVLSSKPATEGRVVCVLVGDGEMKDAIERRVRDCHLERTVVFLGFQPEDRISEMFAAADVLLLNQIAAVKNTVIPSKLLTYMAAGRPVLAAVNDASQGAEILMDANGGVLVAPDDPSALATGIETMMKMDPLEREAMGRRNRAFAETHFDRRKILAEHEAFLFGSSTLPETVVEPGRGPTVASNS